MKKIVLLLVASLFLLLPVFSFAQTDKELEQARSWLGQWKRNFASPTYGVALFHGRLEGGWYAGENQIPDDQRDFPTTAIDLRIFRGVNVSKRGGFYTGVEAGVLFLQNFTDITFNEPTIGEMHLQYNGGLVFLMAKYGLRLDLGIALFGVSLGAELGMGGTLFAGGFEFFTGSPDNPEVSTGFGSSSATMGLILDTAGEIALRIGKNFRLVGKAGIMAAPISIPEKEYKEYYYDYENDTWYYDWGDQVTNDNDLKRAVLNQYSVEIDPFALDLRVGFVLNFQ